MSFEIGIPLSKPTEDQIIATLREKLPALKEYSNEEIPRRVEPPMCSVRSEPSGEFPCCTT